MSKRTINKILNFLRSLGWEYRREGNLIVVYPYFEFILDDNTPLESKYVIDEPITMEFINSDFVLLSIVIGWVESPENVDLSGFLYLNFEIPQLKFCLDASNQILLSLDLPISGLQAGEFSQAFESLSLLYAFFIHIITRYPKDYFSELDEDYSEGQFEDLPWYERPDVMEKVKKIGKLVGIFIKGVIGGK
ncbi:hypothetical protein DRP04_15225, partial [Archaeoglobales archaeon]